jgi:hypothetical protein
MKSFRKLTPLILVALSPLAGCDWLRDWVELNVRESFASYSEAVASKTGGGYSWKLVSLPEAATNIDSLVNLDTGELLVRYKCPPTELSTFLQRCNSVPLAELEYPRKSLSRTLDWWPPALETEQGTSGDGEPLNAWNCNREQSGGALTVTAFLVATDEYVFYWEL